ncbi:MAG TPA: ABC transporter ATP-binding protein [Gemmatimonadaceae bacterium]|nr:ABC transporter ATP-binding protein [Gemmatimonadaceae bacterium]
MPPPDSTRPTTSERPGSVRAVVRALAYLLHYKRDTAGAIVALLLVSAATLATPQFIRIAIDDGIAGHRARIIVLAVAGLLGVAVVRGIFAFVQGFLAERASQGVAYDLRDRLFAHIGHLSFSFYDKVQTGQLLTRLTNDVEQIRTFAGTGVVQVVAAAAMLVGAIALLLAINAMLTVVVLATIAPVVLLLARFVRRIAPLFRLVQQGVGRINAVLQQDLAGVRTIRAYGREHEEDVRYSAANDELLDRYIVTIRAIANNFPFVFFFASLGTLVVIWVGGLQVIGHRLSIGELIAFNSYLAFLVQPLLTLGFLSAGLSRAAASSVRVFEVLDAPLEVHDAPNAVPLGNVRGRVEFRGVCFRYPGTERDVLHDVSFVAEPGQTIALLGATGSGKSTLINLIPRFYDVTEGSVLIDGQDVREVTLESLRRQIGIVLQEVRLFAATVRENIAYGRPEASMSEVERAARAAQADAFIRDLPQGYETVIGERGITLSGGQRQRIAIARALLVDPRLLILDESTSAVDALTEAAIRAALDRLRAGRSHTVFIIAQRVSTVRHADLILVLEDGHIAARGTHEELRRESALYNAILGSQLEGMTDEEHYAAAG